MTQSANARPCNCDQALELQDQINKAQRERGLAYVRAARAETERDQLALEVSAFKRHESVALGQTYAVIEHQEKQLSTISRILCDLVSAPCLSVAQFADPTLERIRIAMLGRER